MIYLLYTSIYNELLHKNIFLLLYILHSVDDKTCCNLPSFIKNTFFSISAMSLNESFKSTAALTR
jgi:hypothetical protein